MDFMDEVLKQIDIGASLEIYGATMASLWVLNLAFRKSYTDWVSPGVAFFMGQVHAFWAHNTYNAHAAVDGFKITAGAIIFQQVINKALEGWSWITKGDSDPVLKAKVEKTSATADSQIEKMKALLSKKNKENTE